MSKRSGDVEVLASLCAAARAKLAAAERSLHDDVGPLISAAGLQIQLLRQDAPALEKELNEVLGVLEKAVERVRRVSQDLNPVPAAMWGLRGALVSLETLYENVSVRCTATARPATATVTALYEAASAAVTAAVHAGASRVTVAASGRASVVVRVTDDGRTAGRARQLSVAALLGREAGVDLQVETAATRKSTIVWIRYAARRTTRG